MLAFMLISTVSFANNNLEKERLKENTVSNSFETKNNLSIFKICNITHNVTDDEGNIINTMNYSISVENDASCSDLSKSLRELSVHLVYFGGLF